MIRLRSLGECVIEIGETRIGPQQEILFAALLILVLEGGRCISRERLISLLYSEAAKGSGRHRLRQILYKLREKGAPIRFEADAVVLESKHIEWDVHSLSSPPFLTQRLPHIVSGFLPTYLPRSSTAREYIDEVRSVVHGQLRQQLAENLINARRAGDWPLISDLAGALLKFDPLNEEAHLALAESLARSGSKLPAVKLLDQYLREVEAPLRDLRLPAATLRNRISEQPIGIERTPSDAMPFVGRHTILSRLVAQCRRAQSGIGTSALLWGPPGIGKSRLLREVACVSGIDGLRCCHVDCRPEERARPLAAITQLVSALRQLPGSLGCSPSSLCWLNRLEACRIDEGGPLTPAQALAERNALRDSLLDLLEAVTDEETTLLMIDNAHWVDQQSWLLIGDVIEWLPNHRASLVLASRSREEGQALGGRATDLASISVGPLEEADAAELLSKLLQPESEAAEAPIARYLALAQGNPLYLFELADNWRRTRDPASTPPSLVESISARITRLTQTELLILWAIAILGRHSSPSTLARLLHMRGVELWLAITNLEESRLIRWQETGFVPAHDLVRDEALKLIPPGTERLLHLEVASILANTTASGSTPTIAWDVSYHWTRGGDQARALQTLIECADHLLWLGLATEAAELLHQGRSLANSPSDLLDLQERECQANYLAGRFGQQLVVYDETTELRAHSARGTQHTNSELLALCARWRSNEDIELLMTSALACGSSAEAGVEHQLTATRWALIFADNACSKEVADQAYAIYRHVRSAHSIEKETVHELEMLYHTNMGDLSRGLEASRELVSGLRSRGNRVQLISALRNSSLVLHTVGEIAEAQAVLQEAYELSVSLRLGSAARGIADTLCGRYLQEGKVTAARLWLDRAQEWNAVADDLEGIRALHHLEARLALAEGDAVRAAMKLSPVLELILSDKTRRRQVALLAYYARLALVTTPERVDRAFCETFESALRLVHNRSGQDGAVYALVLSLLNIGDSRRASGVLQHYLADHRRDRTPVPTPMLEVFGSNAREVLRSPRFQRALLGFSS